MMNGTRNMHAALTGPTGKVGKKIVSISYMGRCKIEGRKGKAPCFCRPTRSSSAAFKSTTDVWLLWRV